MMCLCKQVQQSRWTRQNNFAPIRRVPQEAKQERAIFVFIVASGDATVAAGVVKTFSARRGTMLEGRSQPEELVVVVVTLLSYGCPIQAIVHAYGLDERTVASWRDRAGTHCQKVHHGIIKTGKLNLIHVQADEIRVKGRAMIAWMGLAMMVSTRLWLAGVVSPTRDRNLADRLLQQVRACSQALCAVLISTDGWAAYPNTIKRAFREKVKLIAGHGRACLQVWPELCIATVIKRTEVKNESWR